MLCDVKRVTFSACLFWESCASPRALPPHNLGQLHLLLPMFWILMTLHHIGYISLNNIQEMWLAFPFAISFFIYFINMTHAPLPILIQHKLFNQVFNN